MTLARMMVMGLLLAGCDNLLDARVQNQEICVPAASQAFSGGGGSLGPLPLPGTASKAVTIDFSKPLKQIPGEQAGLKLDVRLDNVYIRSAVADLSFVKRVAVTLVPGLPSDGLPSVFVGEYTKGPGAVAPIKEIKVPSALNANVLDYLKNAPAKLIFTATGRLPAEAFMADVEACVFVQGQATF